LCGSVILLHRTSSSRRLRIRAAVAALSSVVIFLTMGSYSLVSAGSLAQSSSESRALGALLPAGSRYAVFDPDNQIPASSSANEALGPADLAILRGDSSVLGYGSAVSARYDAATAAHQARDLSARGLLSHTFDALDLRVTATLPRYLGTVVSAGMTPPEMPGQPTTTGHPPGALAAESTSFPLPAPPSGPFLVTPSHPGSWLLPGAFEVEKVRARVSGELARGSRGDVVMGLLYRSGSASFERVRIRNGVATWRPPAASGRSSGGAWAVLISSPGKAPVVVDSIVTVLTSLPGSSGGRELLDGTTRGFLLDGRLQGLLPVSRWHFAGYAGDLILERNLLARGQAWLEAPESNDDFSSEVRGGVMQLTVKPWQDPVTVVAAPKPALLVWSEAYDPDWTATLRPATGASLSSQGVNLPVRALGVVEGVEIPAGNWTITWSYHSERAEAGLALAGAGVLAGLVLLALSGRGCRLARRRARGIG
ncbi:MAG: hypothetical protein ACRDZT_05795, partial [Acidimicrobiales bacterium]